MRNCKSWIINISQSHSDLITTAKLCINEPCTKRPWTFINFDFMLCLRTCTFNVLILATKADKKSRSVRVLTGDDPSCERGQEAHADEHQCDEPSSLMTLQCHTHQQTHGTVNEQRRE